MEAQHSRRGSSVLSTALVTIGIGVVVLALAGVALVLFAPPVDLMRARAIAAVKEATGRDLVISGPASMTILPRIGLKMRGVELSAPPEMAGPPTVKVEAIDVRLRLMPLLTGKAELDELVITRPRFDLRVDRDGRRSWTVTSAEGPAAPVRYADARTGGTLLDSLQGEARSIGGRKGDGVAVLADVKLGDVRIVDGSLTYSDARNGVSHAVSSIDLKLAATSISAPVSLNGDLDWRGETVRIDGNLTSLADVLAGRPARIDAKLAARPIEARYAGTANIAGEVALDGNVEAKTPSVRALATWAGAPLPGHDGFGPATFSGHLRASGPDVSLDDAQVALDDVRAAGRVSVRSDGPRPHVVADLATGFINLNIYRDIFAAGTDGAQPAKARPGGGTAPPQSIEDLIEQQSGPRVKGYTAKKGWSDERIDVAALGAADIEARLALEGLQFNEMKAGETDVVLNLRDRTAKVTIQRSAIYQGDGHGEITLDGRSGTPRLAANIVAERISAQPLLKDAADIDWLSGTGTLSVAVTSTGVSERELVSRLDGRMGIAFRNGAISGLDLAGILRELREGKIPQFDTSPSQKTDFSSLDATFTVAQGVATNNDLSLLSPLLRVTGSGDVMLPPRQLDYTLRPKIVAALEGQGGNSALDGLELPVRITGDWERPTFTPDLSKIDLNQAARAVEKVLKSKETGKLVDDLFGKDSKESQKAKKFLDKLFR